MDQEPDVSQVREARRTTVDAAREVWIRKLIDLSRNNRLLYRSARGGGLDLSEIDPEELEKLVRGTKVAVSDLFDEDSQAQANAKANLIRRRALANREEKGIETLFVALGVATWKSRDEGRPPEAPILLVPVEVEVRGREGNRTVLQRAGDIEVNTVLLHALETEHGVRITPEELLADEDPESESIGYERVGRRLLDLVKDKVPEFGVGVRADLGIFAFQKMAMVKDLREQRDTLAAHNLVAAIAGDLEAREAVLVDRRDIDATELDHLPAEDEFAVRDADSSQQRVIHGVVADQDGVIHGPPGTGKSQTIVNLIATLAARGKRVLFVAEKRAALEVVLRRLEEVGLGHLALDLHGASVKRREVLRQVADSFDILRHARDVHVSEEHRRFEDRRRKLNEHVQRMHLKRSPGDMSVFEIQERLLRLPAEATSDIRLRGSDLDRFDRQRIEKLKDSLQEAGALSSLFLRTDPSPWTGMALDTARDAQEALDAARFLGSEGLPRLESTLAMVSAESGLAPAPSMQAASEQAELIHEINRELEKYDPGVFVLNLEGITEALSAGRKGGIKAAWAGLTNREFRRRRKALRTLRKARAGSRELAEESRTLADLKRRWTERGAPGSIPAELESSRLDAALTGVTKSMTTLEKYRYKTGLREGPFPRIKDQLRLLTGDPQTPFRLPRLREIEKELYEAGIQSIVDEIRGRQAAPVFWPQMLDHIWLSSCLDRAREQDPLLAGFAGDHHSQLVEEFRELDRKRLDIAADRVRRCHAEHAFSALNKQREQANLVRHQANLKRKHLPLRRLFGRAPDVLTALRPCWMASPLSVSQLLSADQAFDVVIFDEASQVLPEDAVPALLRGRRAVVAGDHLQLPPTTFFYYTGEDDDDADNAVATEGFESVLDVMRSFIQPWPLDWHYRSRSEQLIAFSNKHIYANRLVTFPSPSPAPAVTHVLVEHAGGDDQEESSSPEVTRVIELVLEHATEMLARDPKDRETLGVIAMGIKHANRLQAALDVARISRPDLDEFFDESQMERFFIKNLERVQGDERDAIILSVGYAKDRSGTLANRMGPLNASENRTGARRLNVAVTRARTRVIAVSSFGHHEMDPRRFHSEGSQLLRSYLEYAATGGQILGDQGATEVALNFFEQDVQEALENEGLTVIPQYGASVYRIDLVVAHPHRPSRPVLAVECDGATYHSAPTARDRDRLRQQHLEALGWRFHRIWSTDWFMARDQEIRRTLARYELAVAHADRVDAGGPTPSAAVAEDPPRWPVAVRAHKPVERTDRPRFRAGLPIDEYSDYTIGQILCWIASDGFLRTDDELVQELMREMGFQRRGAKIAAKLEEMVAWFRREGCEGVTNLPRHVTALRPRSSRRRSSRRSRRYYY